MRVRSADPRGTSEGPLDEVPAVPVRRQSRREVPRTQQIRTAFHVRRLSIRTQTYAGQGSKIHHLVCQLFLNLIQVKV